MKIIGNCNELLLFSIFKQQLFKAVIYFLAVLSLISPLILIFFKFPLAAKVNFNSHFLTKHSTSALVLERHKKMSPSYPNPILPRGKM